MLVQNWVSVEHTESARVNQPLCSPAVFRGLLLPACSFTLCFWGPNLCETSVVSRRFPWFPVVSRDLPLPLVASGSLQLRLLALRSCSFSPTSAKWRQNGSDKQCGTAFVCISVYMYLSIITFIFVWGVSCKQIRRGRRAAHSQANCFTRPTASQHDGTAEPWVTPKIEYCYTT